MTQRRVVCDTDLADGGQVRQENRQRRLDLVEQSRNLVGGAGSRVQYRAQVAVVLHDLPGHCIETSRPGAQVVGALRLRVEQWGAVLNEGTGAVGRRVGVGGDARPRVQQGANVVTRTVERLERLVQQAGQLFFGHAADERVELVEHRADLERDGGVVALDHRTVCEEWRSGAPGYQVDVLLSDSRHAANVGLHVSRYLR